MAKKAQPSDQPEGLQAEAKPAESAPAPAPPESLGPPLPPPALPPPPLVSPPIGAGAGPFGGYRSLRERIAVPVMEILSIVGHVVITAVAACLLFKWIEPWCRPYPWSALAVLVLGNFLWFVLCEVVIVLYQIHEHLSSIDEKTKRG